MSLHLFKQEKKDGEKTIYIRYTDTKVIDDEQVLLTCYISPRGVLNIKADKVLKVQEDRVKGIELISDPEVREAHVKEGRAEDATQDT